MTTQDVGRKLVALCNEMKNIDAVNTLFAKDVVSEEAMDMGTMPRVTKGIEGVRGKNTWWFENHDVHAQKAMGPYPNGDQFAVVFTLDVTPKAGPMAGRRMNMQEVGIYTVKDGKIVHEKFFYSPD